MLVIAGTWRLLPQRLHGVIGTLAIALSFVSAVLLFTKLQGSDVKQVTVHGWNYAKVAGLDAEVSLLVDPLSMFMALVVTGVSALIHLYSVAYMGGDRGYARFFAYLNFFVFSMLLLVLAGNFLLLIVGWAFVGAASYFLISFWYRRTTATRAGIKAFVINVLGDVGLVLGTYFVFRGVHTLHLLQTFDRIDGAFTLNAPSLVAGCILLLVGAFAKSAQVPLHTWLPDAMEGPTPVSALIHAATMVTAGVYLIGRAHPLFEHAPAAADVAAILGTATLLIAASIALVQTDLKRVIAYSTMSQIGYMIVGVSVFAWLAGLFHLMTHAFFKALLFMAAGSVISAMGGEQNMDRMGGFRRAMPFTFITFTFGALALAGFFPFSGIFSKDAILGFEFDRGGLYAVLAVVGYLGSFLTAFYAFRMVFRTFFGEMAPEAESLSRGELAHGEHFNPATGEEEDTEVGFPGPDHQIAEREPAMKVAMAPLAFLAFAAGIVWIPGVTDWLEKFLEPTFADSSFATQHPSTSAEWIGIAVGAVLSIAGIGLAWFLYERRAGATLRLRDRFRPVHDFLFNKWYFDDLYDAVFVHPMRAFGGFGQRVIETDFVPGAIVGGAGRVVGAGTSIARSIQTGYLRAYAFLLLLGVGGLLLYFLIRSA